MALSDVEIWMELQANSLIIEPSPDQTSVNAASIDLHLAAEVDVYKPNPGGVKVDLRDAKAATLIPYASDRINLNDRVLA